MLSGSGADPSTPDGKRELKFLQGCIWKDSRMRICGEVDVVLLSGNPGQEVWSGLVVAIIEMKSGWFELPAALLLQHASKISSAQRGEASLCWKNHRLMLEEPRVFVATLIPPHPFVIGLDPELLRAVSKKLFPGAACGSFQKFRAIILGVPRTRIVMYEYGVCNGPPSFWKLSCAKLSICLPQAPGPHLQLNVVNEVSIRGGMQAYSLDISQSYEIPPGPAHCRSDSC